MTKLTSMQRKVLALYKTALAQERHRLKSCAELAQFVGSDFGLGIAKRRHHANIKMYERLIAHLLRQGNQ